MKGKLYSYATIYIYYVPREKTLPRKTPSRPSKQIRNVETSLRHLHGAAEKW